MSQILMYFTYDCFDEDTMRTTPKYQQMQQTMICHPHSQQGAGTSEIVFILLALGFFVKIGIAIVPAQINDYQLNKLIAEELKRANESKNTPKEFIERLNRQLNINGDYSTKAEEVVSFTNKKTGNLEVRTNYTVVNNFFGNVDIVNRFEKEITMADAE